jgi:hypothetical protein
MRFNSNLRSVIAGLAFWGVSGSLATTIGVYRLLASNDFCLGPWLLLWGLLVFYATTRSFLRCVVWVELNDAGLVYQRLGKRNPESMPNSEILGIVEMKRGRSARTGTKYGFSILGFRSINVAYDDEGIAAAMEREIARRIDPQSTSPDAR